MASLDAIVCDTSSLIRLFKISALGLARLDFDEVYIPTAVYAECPPQLQVQLDQLDFKKLDPATSAIDKYGKGEQAMLNLALERHIENVLTDDAKAIREAWRQGLTVYTALDILVAAKSAGVIASVRDKLNALKSAGEFITQAAEVLALKQAGEL